MKERGGENKTTNLPISFQVLGNELLVGHSTMSSNSLLNAASSHSLMLQAASSLLLLLLQILINEH